MRLFCGILDDRHTLRHDRGHHDIDGRSHGDDVHVNVRSAEHICLGDDHAGRRKAHIRAQGAEALDMLVDRTKADITSARQGHCRAAVLAQKRPDQVIGSSDLAHIIIVHDSVSVDPGTVDPVTVAVDLLDVRADRLDRAQDRADIADIRYILDCNSLVGHHRSGQNAQSCIFGTRNFHFTAQGISPFHNIMFHLSPFDRSSAGSFRDTCFCASPTVRFMSRVHLLFFFRRVSFLSAAWSEDGFFRPAALSALRTPAPLLFPLSFFLTENPKVPSFSPSER